MPGKIILREKILRLDLKLNPEILFVFGDNMQRSGFGGQAKEMRGEPNAVGIPTKWYPDTTLHSYFSNFDLQNAIVRRQIDLGFDKLSQHLNLDKTIIFPSAGIGTGLSQLEFRAPEVLKYIEIHVRKLYQITESL